MSDQFRREYMCEPMIMSPQEVAYLGAWLIYHHCCEEFDNRHFPPNGMPKDANDRKLMYQNVRSASWLANEYLKRIHVVKPDSDDATWRRMKLEALRIVERHPGVELQKLLSLYARL